MAFHCLHSRRSVTCYFHVSLNRFVGDKFLISIRQNEIQKHFFYYLKNSAVLHPPFELCSTLPSLYCTVKIRQNITSTLIFMNFSTQRNQNQNRIKRIQYISPVIAPCVMLIHRILFEFSKAIIQSLIYLWVRNRREWTIEKKKLETSVYRSISDG